LRTARRLSKSFDVIDPSEHYIGVGQPEAACEERALFAAHSIIDLLCRISMHEPVADEFLLDGRDRADTRGASAGMKP
jgi:hypothetical protein